MARERPEATYIPRASTAYKLGKALSAGGNMLRGFGAVAQQEQMRTGMDEAISQYEQFMTEDRKRLQGAQPAEVGIAEVGLGEDMGSVNQLKQVMPKTPDLPTQDTPTVDPMEMAQPAMNAMRSEEEKAQQTVKRTVSRGLAELMESGAPSKDIERTMLQYQLLGSQMARAMNRGGDPRAAASVLNNFMKNKLGYYSNMYGARSRTLEAVIRAQTEAMKESGREERFAGKVAAEVKKGTQKQREKRTRDTRALLGNVTKELMSVRSSISRAQRDGMPVDPTLYEREDTLTSTQEQLRSKLGSPKAKKRPIGPPKPPGGTVRVTDGEKIYTIKRSALNDALAEGLTQVR